MKKLIIAEKPSVARDIARVLKCNTRGEGCLYNDNYIISWAVGHLVTLCEPEDYDKTLKKWDFSTLPIMPSNIKLKAIKNTASQFKLLKELMNSDEVSSLICATDSGREGELIFRYIYELSECKKSFERLWISSMTDAAIKAGFDALRPGSDYDLLYSSAKCRSEADWLVGINATRAFTIKYNALLSVGRVQTPTLALIVDRQREIDEFVPERYFEVEADFSKYKGICVDSKSFSESKIKSEKVADKIVEDVKGKNAVVHSVSNEEKKVPPPQLYDLTEIQREANKKYGFSAKKTLDTVQSLYEKHKAVTYPRTDSRYLSDDMIPKLKPIAEKLSGTEEYKQWADYVLGLEKLPITKRIVDNSKINDHHAIIPTETRPRLQAFSEDERKIYDLIARRFLQVFYPHYVYSSTKIITECENHYFLTKGNTVLQPGWTELNVTTGKEKKKEKPLPVVNKGDTYAVKGAKKKEKKTTPPSSYNEASLLDSMEHAGKFVDDETLKEQLKESGLGTPATRAGIIERLIKVGYVKRSGKNLIPTDKGKKLISVVMPELRSPETTGKWEKGLMSISKGNMDPNKFMGSIKKYVQYIVGRAEQESTSVIFESEQRGRKKGKTNALGKCPLCGGEIFENTKAYFCGNWKNGCRFTVWKTSKDYPDEITPNVMSNLLKSEDFLELPNCALKYNKQTGRIEVRK